VPFFVLSLSYGVKTHCCGSSAAASVSTYSLASRRRHSVTLTDLSLPVKPIVDADPVKRVFPGLNQPVESAAMDAQVFAHLDDGHDR